MLIALDAQVHLVGSDGEGTIPVEDLYRNDGMAHLTKTPDEIITEVTIPPLGAKRATYTKLRRRESIDFPILGVAAAIELDDGVCTAARIVLGAVASAPLRVETAETALLGRPFTDETITESAEAARKLARPLNNTDLTSRYRKRMIPIFVTRTLKQLTDP